jgi:hypothetical protein
MESSITTSLENKISKLYQKEAVSSEATSFLFISELFSKIMSQILNSNGNVLVLAVKFTNTDVFYNHKTSNGAMIPKLSCTVVPLAVLKLF